ncbi:MAG: glycerol-3-phosphate acyltransferase, partial [Clostridia bacterium]|nr:glycerol-3-phosphate acyltransferase [Clostridia bacterium]
MNYLLIAVFAVVAYLLGSINSSILIGRLFGVKDIRKHGSGNAGATNTLRTIGKKAAILALIGDALKGVIAILLTRLVLGMFIEGDLL